MKKKIFIIYLITLSAGILLTGFLSLSLLRNNYINQSEKKLVSNARLIETFIKKNAADSFQMQTIVNELKNKTESRITIIDAKGNVLADSNADPLRMENQRDRPEVKMAYGTGIGKSIRYSTAINGDMLYIAVPVQLREDKGIIRLAASLKGVDIYKGFYYSIGLSIILGLILSLAVGYRFIDRIMQPINEITEASKEIAAGQFNRRVYISSNDEMGKLADNFNNMADRLKGTIEQLADNNTKFKALLASIINPIIAVDNKRNVILFNTAAEKLFKIKAEDALGKHILEVIRNNVLDEEIKHIFQNNIETQVEITLMDSEEKILKIHTNLIRLEKDPDEIIGIVALLEDVTEIRKLEKMRSDFVANVSHELKTPLTSISGFIETLKSGSIDNEETKMRFLDIIEIETARLTRLIEDILTLSEIENIHNNLSQEIRPSQSIKEIEEIMKPIAYSKNIRFNTEIELELPVLYGNKDWFKQMLINLIDNAVKYTPAGGKVQVSAYKKYNNIVITVKDSGIGIPKKDLPRLFERFYRVDKARSRKVGGTGLGLAIVKHIVLSFKGRIKVNSEQGKGSEFTIILPINYPKQ